MQPLKKSRKSSITIGNNTSGRKRQKDLQTKHSRSKVAKESLHSRNNSKGVVHIVESKDIRLGIVGTRKDKMVVTTITTKEATIEEVKT
jgi:hypothetical protein